MEWIFLVIAGGLEVFWSEVFQWIYGNKIHNTDGGRHVIQLSFSFAGNEDIAAGNSLCSLDWNWRTGSCYSGYRTV